MNNTWFVSYVDPLTTCPMFVQWVIQYNRQHLHSYTHINNSDTENNPPPFTVVQAKH